MSEWLSDAIRGWVIAQLQEGVAIWKVTRHLAVIRSVVQRLRDHFADTGSLAEARKPGCPWAINRQQDEFIILVTEDRTTTTLCLKDPAVNISDQMICSWLKGANLYSRWPVLSASCLGLASSGVDNSAVVQGAFYRVTVHPVLHWQKNLHLETSKRALPCCRC